MTDRRRLVNAAAATMGRRGDGSVVFDDPAALWVVRMWPSRRPGERGQVRRIRIDVRDGGPDITAARLARLPLSTMLRVATGHPRRRRVNESYYQMLAQPKPPGSRSWDDGHWDRVLTVADWAVTTERPGGPAQAIADMWGVSLDPTAYRWLSIARRRAEALK